MGFSFDGMMRGLGVGLANTGVLMKEQQKLEWETEQERLRAERAERLQRLQLEGQATMQKQGFTHAEAQTKMQIDNANANASRAFSLDEQRLQGEQKYQQASLANQGAARASDDRLNAAKLAIVEKEALREQEKWDMSKAEYNKREAVIEKLPPSAQAQIRLGIKSDGVDSKDKEIADRMSQDELAVLMDPENSTKLKMVREQTSKELGIPVDEVDSYLPSLIYGKNLDRVIAASKTGGVLGQSVQAPAPEQSNIPTVRDDKVFIFQFKEKPVDQQLSMLSSMNSEQKSVLAKELGYGTVPKMIAELQKLK